MVPLAVASSLSNNAIVGSVVGIALTTFLGLVVFFIRTLMRLTQIESKIDGINTRLTDLDTEPDVVRWSELRTMGAVSVKLPTAERQS